MIGEHKHFGNALHSKHCTKLAAWRAVTLNNGLQRIRDNAFHGCTSLESIMLPSSLTWAPRGLECDFWYCKALESIGVYAFNTCRNLKNVVLNEGLLTIRRSAFFSAAVS
jgi:hypothetical protein